CRHDLPYRLVAAPRGALPPKPRIRRVNMGLTIWLIVGGIIGWLASLIMRTDAQQGILLNVVDGIIGALIGGRLIAPPTGGSTSASAGFDIMGFIAALIGAIILLAIVNLFRRGRVR